MTNIQRIDGVEDVHADQLKKSKNKKKQNKEYNITTVEKLLMVCKDLNGLTALADDTGIGNSQILKWVFSEWVKGVDDHYNNLMGTVKDVIKRLGNSTVTSLVISYQILAETFYEKYYASLHDTLVDLLEQIQLLKSVTNIELLNELKVLIDEKEEAYADLQGDAPMLMQNCLSKLEDEWDRVYQVVAAQEVATRDENKEYIPILSKLVHWAAHDIGIDTVDMHIFVVPQMGDSYALQFFNYTDNMMALTLSPSALRAPWEWSVLWHEMAGYKIRRLESSDFTKLDKYLQETRVSREQLLKAYQTLSGMLIVGAKSNASPIGDDTFGEKSLNKIKMTIEYMIRLAAQEYGEPESRIKGWLKNGVVETTVPDFGEQLQSLKKMLLRERSIHDYEEAMKIGWCEDWIKELFEDACSVQAFGQSFLISLDNILKRYPDSDANSVHPPRKMRLTVAENMLKLTGTNKDIGNTHKLDDFIADRVAKQIYNMMPLLTKRPSNMAIKSNNISLLDNYTLPFSIWRLHSQQHTVELGENLQQIAKKYNVPQESIDIDTAIRSTVPFIEIIRVEADSNKVTVKLHNFPIGESIEFTMGEMGVSKVGVMHTESPLFDNSNVVTITIPLMLREQHKIAVRAETNSGYAAYNWFATANFSRIANPNQTLLIPAKIPTKVELEKALQLPTEQNANIDNCEKQLKAVKQFISDEMDMYSGKITDIRKDTFTLLGTVKTECDQENRDKALDEEVRRKKINMLLNGKNYKELLEILFYDTDFLSDKYITDVIHKVTGKVLFPKVMYIKMPNLVSPKGTGKGEVIYTTRSGIKKVTTKKSWNIAFKDYRIA